MPLHSGASMDGTLKTLCEKYSGEMDVIINDGTKWNNFVTNAIVKVRGNLSGNYYAGIPTGNRSYLHRRYVNGQGNNPSYLNCTLLNTSYTKKVVYEKVKKKDTGYGTHRVVFEWIYTANAWRKNRVFYSHDHYTTFYIMEYRAGNTLNDNY